MHLGCEDEYAKPDNFVLGKLLASVIIKNIYKLWECDKASLPLTKNIQSSHHHSHIKQS